MTERTNPYYLWKDPFDGEPCKGFEVVDLTSSRRVLDQTREYMAWTITKPTWFVHFLEGQK